MPEQVLCAEHDTQNISSVTLHGIRKPYKIMNTCCIFNILQALSLLLDNKYLLDIKECYIPILEKREQWVAEERFDSGFPDAWAWTLSMAATW